MIRGMAVAALAALGEGGDANVDTLMAVMAEPNVAFCMNMAKLNLYQCLAVSKPHYEDVFCLGQHIMMDTGRCVIKASGTPSPTRRSSFRRSRWPTVRPLPGDPGQDPGQGRHQEALKHLRPPVATGGAFVYLRPPFDPRRVVRRRAALRAAVSF
uniref:Uncharacterized protein n=1 Tax=Phenylobacterium glaciei TaxID=2803784 RepID=A0A974S7Z5_9CAUL|nr:hypothetical protein JKL49_23805 [Phenylobacterium glaciei]